jgi:AcrR family transcriptional regulator
MSPKTTAVAREPGHRSRRASSDVEDAILRATVDLLDEVGFEKLTVEAVAARSGAAKTAVYRRWPSKVPLVVEALTRSRPEPGVPDTGDLRTDLVALWMGVTGHGRRSVERLLPVLRTSLAAGDELRTLLWERYFEPRLQASYAVITRAAARGEVRADADPALAFDLLFGPLVYRWLRGSPPDEETIGRVVGLALRGLAPLHVLGGELGAEAEEHGAGGGVEAAADLAAHQQAPGAMQSGDEHEQVGQAEDRVTPGQHEQPAEARVRGQELRQHGEVEDQYLGVGDVGDEALPPAGHALRHVLGRAGRVVAVQRRVLAATG